MDVYRCVCVSVYNIIYVHNNAPPIAACMKQVPICKRCLLYYIICIYSL